jgi:hypothetical protein
MATQKEGKTIYLEEILNKHWGAHTSLVKQLGLSVSNLNMVV